MVRRGLGKNGGSLRGIERGNNGSLVEMNQKSPKLPEEFLKNQLAQEQRRPNQLAISRGPNQGDQLTKCAKEHV